MTRQLAVELLVDIMAKHPVKFIYEGDKQDNISGITVTITLHKEWQYTHSFYVPVTSPFHKHFQFNHAYNIADGVAVIEFKTIG